MICPDRVFLPRWGEEPVPVRADQGLIKQVMRILMDNAIKYSSPGSRIYLRLSTQERYARLTVQDEGDGIPPESIPHIFERFYRTDQSRDRKTGGTGLGLSIARWIVERHEGWFEVVSRPVWAPASPFCCLWRCRNRRQDNVVCLSATLRRRHPVRRLHQRSPAPPSAA